ncbi:MAG: T9SS type A sorting domain-containing protein, partial [Candidatus Marinimicrobia bacterium]|nr:T9SS type A sorting domain-containing protein [Candidatus Neomarinimicrobiota bacterium]
AYIYVLDPQTGALLDTLDMTGVTGGFYGISLMKADAADDGVIYACNLASGGDFKIYRWEDETSVPTVALTQAVTVRFGDVLEVTGSGTGTRIYASARGGTEIKVFGTADGATFSEIQSIPITAGAADGGISIVDDATLWVNAAWKNATKIDTAGTVLATTSVPDTYYGNVLFMQATNGSKLLAVNANHNEGNRRKIKVYNITEDEVTPALWAEAEMGNIEKANANVAGNIKFKHNPDGTITLYQMATNNAIATWTLEVPEFVEITPIADVKADLDGDFRPDLEDSVVTVRGTVFTPNYTSKTSLYIEDGTGGVNIFSSSVTNSFVPGDIIQVTGTVDFYNGLTEIAVSSSDDMLFIGSGTVSVPETVSLADIGETYEGNLVKVEKVKLLNPSAWPAAGSDANLQVTDGIDTLVFRIDKESDLDGMTAPTWEFDLVGVVTQYTFANPANDGYQITGTFYDQLTFYSPILDELDENFETWTELSPEWEFENIFLANDAYALEGTGKYLGLANLDSAGYAMTPFIQDPKELTFHLAEHTGGSDNWHLNVLLVDQTYAVVDTLLELNAPGDFDWHKHVVDIFETGVYAVKFHAEPVVAGSMYLDHIMIKAPEAVPLVTPASLNFAVVGINAAKTMVVKLTNDAPETAVDLVIDSLVSSQGDFFALIDTDLLAPGDTADIFVTYMPKDETADNASLSVYTSGGVVTVALSGNGELIWPLNWRVTADADWMGVTANAPRTMAYSAKSNHLYFVAHPNGYGDFLKAFDAEDGSFVKDLALLNPLPSAGYIKINAVAATTDGQVFSCNLSSGSTFNLFRNENEDAEMNLAYSGGGIPIRVGDALAASGEGLNTKVYVSGTSAPYIYVFETADGASFTLADSIAVLPGAASRGIAPVGNGDYFFINGTGSAPQYVKSDGTVLYTFDTGVVPSGTAINYFEVETSGGWRRFVGISNCWSSGTKVVELLGAPGDNLCSSVAPVDAPTDNYATNPNANATGMAVYSVYDNALIELVTNNGVSSYSFEKIEDAPIIPERDTTAIAGGIPDNFMLHQNYPNPFNPTTTIRFDLPADAKVNLAIYDITGRKIRTLINGTIQAGYNRVVWNGTDNHGNPISTGMYIYKLQAGDQVDIKKMTFLK